MTRATPRTGADRAHAPDGRDALARLREALRSLPLVATELAPAVRDLEALRLPAAVACDAAIEAAPAATCEQVLTQAIDLFAAMADAYALLRRRARERDTPAELALLLEHRLAFCGGRQIVYCLYAGHEVPAGLWARLNAEMARAERNRSAEIEVAEARVAPAGRQSLRAGYVEVLLLSLARTVLADGAMRPVVAAWALQLAPALRLTVTQESAQHNWGVDLAADAGAAPVGELKGQWLRLLASDGLRDALGRLARRRARADGVPAELRSRLERCWCGGGAARAAPRAAASGRVRLWSGIAAIHAGLAAGTGAPSVWSYVDRSAAGLRLCNGGEPVELAIGSLIAVLEDEATGVALGRVAWHLFDSHGRQLAGIQVLPGRAHAVTLIAAAGRGAAARRPGLLLRPAQGANTLLLPAGIALAGARVALCEGRARSTVVLTSVTYRGDGYDCATYDDCP